MNIYEERESEVRSYCRHFPIVFKQAKNAYMYDIDGNEYIDFFAGAGAINFGHNNPYIKSKLLDYLSENNIIHALDMYTEAKGEFLESFQNLILEPRNLDYKIMCCGSTGTNAIEAALKLARKNTKRTNVIAFSGAFHGMTLGSLAVSSDRNSRKGAGVSLDNVSFAPYATEFDDYRLSLKYLNWMIADDHSGIDKPACIILETIQAEGGVNVANHEWLKGVRKICDENDILMVIDDIQVGIGRNATFFSWEKSGVVPDMVILSKSISGFGLPMSLLLIKPQYDIFRPSEHNGTFRGLQLSFVCSKAAMEYFTINNMQKLVEEKEIMIREFLLKDIMSLDYHLIIRGSGMIWGIDFRDFSLEICNKVMKECVKRGLIIEKAGRNDRVLKILPPLTIEKSVLLQGLNIIYESIQAVIANDLITRDEVLLYD